MPPMSYNIIIIIIIIIIIVVVVVVVAIFFTKGLCPRVITSTFLKNYQRYWHNPIASHSVLV